MNLKSLLDLTGLELEKDIQLVDNEIVQCYVLKEDDVDIYVVEASEEYEDLFTEIGDILKRNDKVLEAKIMIYIIAYIVSDTYPTGPTSNNIETVLEQLAELYAITTFGETDEDWI